MIVTLTNMGQTDGAVNCGGDGEEGNGERPGFYFRHADFEDLIR